MRLPLFLIPLLGFAPGLIAAADNDTLAHAPGPRPTAEQVLSGNIPGRPLVAPIIEERDETGFASEKLYKVPPVGQHPRILFSAADLPRIRAQLDATKSGRDMKADMLKRTELGEASGWSAQAYAALVAGDVAGFTALWADTRNPIQKGAPGAGFSPLSALLFYRGFSALLLDDAARGREVAAAVATYATWMRPQVEAASKLPGAENYWLQVRPVIGDFGGLGYLYDFTQRYMTPGQADGVRGLIALCIKDRYGLGMDLPPHWRNWNFLGMGLYFPQLALSIEGEAGFEPRIVARAREVARDYILHGISPLGLGKEGMGYQTAGMGHVNVFALALANRGDNLITLKRYRAMVENWMLWTMQPYGREWASNGDLGTFPPAATVLQTARFFYPKNPRIALIAGQAPEVAKLDSRVPEQSLLMLLTPADLGFDVAAKHAPEFPAGLPLSLYEPERGVLFARTGWKTDDLTFQFNARSDTTFASHDHADRGDFFLTALGQAWSVPAMRETGSEHHSVITIDDVGQGFFATPATWLDVQDSPAGATATVDLSYCYNWRWMKSSFFATDEQLKNEPWLEWAREPRDRLLARAPLATWERDPSPKVRAYYEGWLACDPRGWGAEDSWVVRGPNLPVKKAFRSIAVVRAASPFVVITDDIREDDAEHLYQWRMILSSGVEAQNLNGTDIILGPVSAQHEIKRRGDSAYKDIGRPLAKQGDPQLLVRTLRLARPKFVERTPAPAVETVEFVKNDDVHQFSGRSLGVGKRLVLPSRSVEPGYRVLLFPHRAGEALPETKWETPDVLAVTAKGVTSRVRFTDAPDGSTRLAILP